MRRRIFRLFVRLLVVLLFVTAFAALAGVVALRRAKPWLEAVASDVVGRAVRIEGLAYRYPDGFVLSRVEVEGIGFAEGIAARVDLAALREGRFFAPAVRVAEASLRLERDASGRWNFEGLFPKADPDAPPAFGRIEVASFAVSVETTAALSGTLALEAERHSRLEGRHSRLEGRHSRLVGGSGRYTASFSGAATARPPGATAQPPGGTAPAKTLPFRAWGSYDRGSMQAKILPAPLAFSSGEVRGETLEVEWKADGKIRLAWPVRVSLADLGETYAALLTASAVWNDSGFRLVSARFGGDAFDVEAAAAAGGGGARIEVRRLDFARSAPLLRMAAGSALAGVAPEGRAEGTLRIAWPAPGKGGTFRGGAPRILRAAEVRIRGLRLRRADALVEAPRLAVSIASDGADYAWEASGRLRAAAHGLATPWLTGTASGRVAASGEVLLSAAKMRLDGGGSVRMSGAFRGDSATLSIAAQVPADLVAAWAAEQGFVPARPEAAGRITAEAVWTRRVEPPARRVEPPARRPGGSGASSDEVAAWVRLDDVRLVFPGEPALRLEGVSSGEIPISFRSDAAAETVSATAWGDYRNLRIRRILYDRYEVEDVGLYVYLAGRVLAVENGRFRLGGGAGEVAGLVSFRPEHPPRSALLARLDGFRLEYFFERLQPFEGELTGAANGRFSFAMEGRRLDALTAEVRATGRGKIGPRLLREFAEPLQDATKKRGLLALSDFTYDLFEADLRLVRNYYDRETARRKFSDEETARTIRDEVLMDVHYAGKVPILGPVINVEIDQRIEGMQLFLTIDRIGNRIRQDAKKN